MGERRGSYKVLVGKTRIFARPRHKRKDKIRTDLEEIGQQAVNRNDLSHERNM
jgi:hypothetical protein